MFKTLGGYRGKMFNFRMITEVEVAKIVQGYSYLKKFSLLRVTEFDRVKIVEGYKG